MDTEKLSPVDMAEHIRLLAEVTDVKAQPIPRCPWGAAAMLSALPMANYIIDLKAKSDGQAEMIEGYQADVLGKRLLDEREMASMLGLAKDTIRAMRAAGTGPKFINLCEGKQVQVRYRLSDVEDWLTARTGAWRARDPEREDSTPDIDPVPERE